MVDSALAAFSPCAAWANTGHRREQTRGCTLTREEHCEAGVGPGLRSALTLPSESCHCMGQVATRGRQCGHEGRTNGGAWQEWCSPSWAVPSARPPAGTVRLSDFPARRPCTIIAPARFLPGSETRPGPSLGRGLSPLPVGCLLLWWVGECFPLGSLSVLPSLPLFGVSIIWVLISFS